MEIKRERYLNKIIESKNNGLIKVITGLRRSGKSYLLNSLFKQHLLNEGIHEDQIILFAFDNMEDILKLDSYLIEKPTLIFDSKGNYKVNANKFVLFIKDLTSKVQPYYLLLDEIQLLDAFVPTLNGFLRHENFDTYVTGSNSRMLSKDILTEFRGRGDQIHVYPLSFKEFYGAANISFEDAYSEFQYFGGMPYLLSLNSEEKKKQYLKDLYSLTYIKDIVDRNGIEDTDSFERLLQVLSSSIGSYANPTNLENTFKSEAHIVYGHETIKKHIEGAKDAFLLSEAKRYDINGKRLLGANSKYYFTDIGLRNALLNFKEEDVAHIMENIIYNELRIRGYDVDVGIVEVSEKNVKGNYVSKQLETDFVCNRLGERIYVQSAYSLESLEKRIQEKKPLLRIKDNFRKMIVVKDSIKPYFSEEGIEVIGLKDFLLKERI